MSARGPSRRRAPAARDRRRELYVVLAAAALVAAVLYVMVGHDRPPAAPAAATPAPAVTASLPLAAAVACATPGGAPASTAPAGTAPVTTGPTPPCAGRLTPGRPAASTRPRATAAPSTRTPSAPASPPASSSAPRPVSPPAPGAGAGPSSAAAAQVLALINSARAQAGLPPYTITAGLNSSAAAHTTVMAAGCGLSHQCPGEPALGTRESNAGVHWTAAGENIGEGGPVANTPAAIAAMATGLTQDMLNEKPPDDGHRLNILSSAFTHAGISVYRDNAGTVWMTQDFSN